MNGLCGWIGAEPGAAPPEQILAAMAEALRTPLGNPSVSGVGAAQEASSDPNCAIWVGGPAGRYSLAVDGDVRAAIEGYPRWTNEDLAALARDKGHAAALAEAYRRDGRALFRHISGPFSLAVLEPGAGKALLAIDRFAVHSLCVAQAGSAGLVFGATTQAVRAHPAVTATIAPQSILDFLMYYVCPSPRTIYREQMKLQPGQYLHFDHGRIDRGFYWRMPYREDSPAQSEALAAELEERLETAVRRAAGEEDPARVGAFLSGGLDSSTVVGMLKRVTGRRPQTFTLVFQRDTYDESRFARAAAEHFDAVYQEYTLTPRDVLDFIPRIAEAYDEPFGNSSAIPAYYCARMAAERGIELLLAGDGGDELFAGNERYVEQMVFEAYKAVPQPVRRHAIEPAVFAMPFTGRMAPVRKARNLISRARIPLPDRLETYNFWQGIDLADAFEPDILAAIDPDAALEVHREVYGRADSDALVQRMMHLDLTAALADNDLRKVNRMCALAGVRVRYPFLDEDVAELSARIPPKILVKRGRLRDFFKRALADFLPHSTLTKKKHGFGMPFEEWLKENKDLRAFARDALHAFSGRGYLKQSFVYRIISAHEGTRAAPSDSIVWDLVMLELWLRAHGHAA